MKVTGYACMDKNTRYLWRINIASNQSGSRRKGSYAGEEKWKLAIALIQVKGFDVDSEEVVAALKAEWEALDLQQITAGVKETAEEKSPYCL
jgi:hypothetical protein